MFINTVHRILVLRKKQINKTNIKYVANTSIMQRWIYYCDPLHMRESEQRGWTRVQIITVKSRVYREVHANLQQTRTERDPIGSFFLCVTRPSSYCPALLTNLRWFLYTEKKPISDDQSVLSNIRLQATCRSQRAETEEQKWYRKRNVLYAPDQFPKGWPAMIRFLVVC